MIPYRGLKSVTIKQSMLWNPFKVNRKTIMSVNWEQSLLISEVEAGHRTIGRASEKRLSSYTRPAPKQQQWRTLWSIATWSTVSIQYSLMRRDATCKLQDIYPALKNWQTAATHTHTRACLTALCLGLSGWADTRKVKPIWISLKQETVSGSGVSWTICKSAPRYRQITTPAPHHSVFLTGSC